MATTRKQRVIDIDVGIEGVDDLLPQNVLNQRAGIQGLQAAESTEVDSSSARCRRGLGDGCGGGGERPATSRSRNPRIEGPLEDQRGNSHAGSSHRDVNACVLNPVLGRTSRRVVIWDVLKGRALKK